jgi:hypothetical protein
MSAEHFLWQGRAIPFRRGQSIAGALLMAGVSRLGRTDCAAARYFCGIGACQGCTVLVDGTVREACLTPAAAGAAVEPLPEAAP